MYHKKVKLDIVVFEDRAYFYKHNKRDDENIWFSTDEKHGSPVPQSNFTYPSKLRNGNYKTADGKLISKKTPLKVGWLDWICLTTTHVLQDILAVLHR